MIVINFNEKVPEFGDLIFDGKRIKTKDPYQIFSIQKKSKGSVIFNMECSCPNPDCTNKVSFYYHGLNYYINSKSLGGDDTKVDIQPYYKKEEGKANNVTWNPTEENATQFITFLETAREAIAFKQELKKDLYAELQVGIKGYSDIRIMIRKEELEFRFILFEIPSILSKVPLLYEAKSYFECLGIISTIPSDTDISGIKNDYANMKDPFFAPIIEWINLLGKENELDLVISNIWVMPE